ncbi:hypothetical protein Ddye_005641 [Dipteronia dyeriana]|uniref:Uncharacterized protein n=1 Tax=Dipteronia dyeriana TaxID=168575 RepID=A0AAD9XHI1_9ROSI|nr:hypothetical protein Ddye_005641 [Dipteronia dyeriana]
MVEMQVEHRLYLLYSKAWRAKDHAEASVFGPPEESFKLLPAYCHRLEEVNPGTITTLKTKDGNKGGLVNLYEKTYSFAKFEVDKLPCRYALAAIRYANKPLPNYCGDCYKTTSWVEAYVGTIFPIGHPSDWNIPEDVRSKVVLLPHFRAQAGRPRKKRFKYVGEHGNGKTRNCTICKKSGHNRQNYRNAQPCQAPPPCPSLSSTTSVTSK